jgi:N-acetylglucosamine kinase-like BadF-type ATPase
VTPTIRWAGKSDVARADELQRLGTEVLQPAGVTAVVAGVHGCDSEEQQQTLGDALRNVIPVSNVVNDAELVLPAAGLVSGTGIVAGTGSCATSTDTDGRRFMVGGWGWVLGDEGSATAIVRDAAREVLALADSGVEDALTPALLAAMEAQQPHALGYLLSTVPPENWAQHARVVFASSKAGSAGAARVLQLQIEGLVSLLRTVKHRGGDITAIAHSGGVFTSQPGFSEAFGDAARAAFPEVQTVRLVTEPTVAGALKLAFQLREREVAS